MKMVRFYRKGQRLPYTVSEKYYKQLQKDGREFIDNANYAMVLESDEEEKSWFFDSLRRVYENPKYYLDNLDSCMTFRVSIGKIFPNKIKSKKSDKYID